MKESIAGTWLLGLVLGFTMIFVGFLCVMINYSTVFKTKNEVVSMIEKYEGLQNGPAGSVKIINNYLYNSSYASYGKCTCTSEKCWGVTRDPMQTREAALKGQENLTKISSGDEVYWCASYNNTGEKEGYYDVEFFINFEVPVLKNLGKFRVKGQTIKIKYLKPYENI